MTSAYNQRRFGQPRAAAEAVAKVTRTLFQRRGLADGAIVRDWPLIFGEALAEHSQPERILFPRGKRQGGVLHLRVASGGMALELQHLEPLVLERINGYFGYRAVGGLKVVQGPLPRPPKRAAPQSPATDEAVADDIKQALHGVNDEALRHTLARLARAVAGRNRQRQHRQNGAELSTIEKKSPESPR